MENLNLLEFLNNAKYLYASDFAMCDDELINFLDLIKKEEQFVKKLNFGIMYVHQRELDKYTVVDGLNRIVSLSLLLHAICECYKKTSAKNDSAINKIRSKYLVYNNKTKLRLTQSQQIIYEKIINGEKLSGKEKNSPLFVLLHKFWTQIKEEKLQASTIFHMLEKIFVLITDIGDVSAREVFYALNKNNTKLNQLLLIEDYLKSIGLKKEWNLLSDIFQNNSNDIMQFFKDFFTTKFSFNEFNTQFLYENFVNYFETMLQYLPKATLIENLQKTAHLYQNIIYINLTNEKLKKALIQIKMHQGEDTYAYLLSIYEDFVDGNLTEATFLEILSTVAEYLKNRSKTPNNVPFNELISYLNAFITCK